MTKRKPGSKRTRAQAKARAPRNRDTLRGGAKRNPRPLGSPISAAEGRVLASQLMRLQEIYAGTNAISVIAERKKLIGTRTEEDLKSICDEIDAEVITLAESLGFTLDDVIAGERD